MLSALGTRAVARAAVIGAYVLAVEYARALWMRSPGGVLPGLILGGAALGVAALAFSPQRLGLRASRLPLRIIGGLGLGAVLLLPAAARVGSAPLLPASLALAAVIVSVGEEIAFRGALYAALEEVGGAPAAIAGSTLLWTLAHALSHPPMFLGAVAAAGLLLALWRWAFKDLVAPVIAHVIADLAL